MVARERAFLSFFFCFSGDFASAEATRGLSGRTLDPFGVHPVEADGDHKKFLVRGKGKRLLSFSCFLGAFASAEATRGLSARPLDPFGAHPYMRGQNLPQETNSLQKAGKGPTFLFPVSQRVSPLRRRPKGFPVALWKPSALCCAWGIPQKTDFLWQAGKEPSLLFPYHKRFRLCGGDQGVFRSPPGPLRGSGR